MEEEKKMEEVTKKVENQKKGTGISAKIKVIIGVAAVLVIALIVAIIIIISKGAKNGTFGMKEEEKFTVKASETKQLKLIDYDGGNFTMKIPEGWTVTTGGTEMYYTIRVQDPNDERNQIFTTLKAAPFLKSNAAKQWHTGYVNITGNQAYKVLSDAIILNPATTENFYLNFNNYTDYIKKYEPTLSNFEFPFLSVFTKVEEFESNSYMKAASIDDKTIRATFEDLNGKPAEGLFMATTVNAGNVYAGSVDTCFYYVYNVTFISSAKDEFVNYQSILNESIGSLQYKESFVNATNTSIKEKTDAALKANATVQAAFNSYNSAWNTRQKTYDITSQKYSDSTLGYERVYNTDTGEIYKAYNGFTDDYDGNKYKPVTEDMYTQSVSGYIEK